MKRKIFSAVLIFLAACMIFGGCADEIPEPLVSEAQTLPPAPDLPPVEEPYPASFDGEVFESSPMTVATLSPSLTEMVYELGFGDRIVAVGDCCERPAEAADKQRIGSPANPDIEAITALKPELLLTSSPVAATDRLLLKQAGVRVIELSQPTSFAGLCEIYIKLALAFCGKADARQAAETAYSGADGVLMEIVRNFEPKKFVVVEGYADGGLMLSPPGTLSGDIFSVFGENLWTGPGYYADDDTLFEISPRLVFYSDETDRDDVRKTFPYAKLVAIDFERVEQPSGALEELLRNAYAEASEED